MDKESLRIIYITGEGRSGSTLLDRILGQADGFVSCGEMWLLWERGYEENQLCGCGHPFRECFFWSKVIARTVSQLEYPELGHALEVQKSIMRLRYIPWLLSPRLQPQWYREKLSAFAKTIKILYSAVLAEAGADVIIDSSKMPLYGLLLAATGVFDVNAVHLVRNSNAVTYSWQRKRVRSEIIERVEYMPTMSALSSAVQWMKENILSEVLTRYAKKGVVVRYEDLMSHPSATVHALLYEFGLHDRAVHGLAGATVMLGSNHIPSGNPMRFKSGEICLREDDEWRHKMSRPKRALVTGLTLPLLLRYGYRCNLS